MCFWARKKKDTQNSRKFVWTWQMSISWEKEKENSVNLTNFIVPSTGNVGRGDKKTVQNDELKVKE